MARDRLDIGGRGELRQQHHSGVGGADELAQSKRVHVVERRGDEESVGGEVLPLEPRLHHPDMAPVRQHHALGRSGRAGGVEEHRRLVGPSDDGVEPPGIEEGGKVLTAVARKAQDRQPCWALLPPWRVAEYQPRAAIAQDEGDGLGRKPVIDRHRDEACAHDAVIGGEIFHAVGGQDGDALAARKSARREAAGDRHRHGVEIAIGEAPLALAAEIDDGELGRVAVAADEVAEIGECGRHARGVTPSAAR